MQYLLNTINYNNIINRKRGNLINYLQELSYTQAENLYCIWVEKASVNIPFIVIILFIL